MMNSRRVYRLLNIHIEVDDVGDHTEYGVDDRRPNGAPNCEPEASILAQNDRWSHHGEWSLARRNSISFSLNESVHVGRAGFCSEVVHLIVEQHAGAFNNGR